MGNGIQRKPGATTLVDRSLREPARGELPPGKRTLAERLIETPDVSRAAAQAQVDRAVHDSDGPLRQEQR